MFRVVSWFWPGYWCGACLLSNNHYRVQKLAVTNSGGQKLAPKWERAFTTECGGLWVHVYSDYRWCQEPRPPFPDDHEQTITASTEDTLVPLQQVPHVVDEEKPRTNPLTPQYDSRVHIVGIPQHVNDNGERRVHLSDADDTDLSERVSGIDGDNHVPSGKVVMEHLQEPAQGGVQVPLHKETGAPPEKRCHNKIPKPV